MRGREYLFFFVTFLERFIYRLKVFGGMADKRNRAWCWTLFIKKDDGYTIENKFILEKIKYFIYQLEICPSTGKEHLQGYTLFHEAVSMKSAKKLLGLDSAHFEIRRGTHEEAVNYCKKSETKAKDFKPVEFGEVRTGQGKRNDIAKAKEMILNGENMRAVTLETTGYQAARYAELLLKYHEKPRNWKPVVKWFWGSTGSGKTAKALEESDPSDTYTTMKNAKWFEGYDAHKHVIFDEFRGDFCTYHELLRLLDRYECRVECKCGSRQFVATHIWITSCYPPDKVYSTREDIGQLLRRIDVIEKFESNDKTKITQKVEIDDDDYS